MGAVQALKNGGPAKIRIIETMKSQRARPSEKRAKGESLYIFYFLFGKYLFCTSERLHYFLYVACRSVT
jgi:hypothetical protein